MRAASALKASPNGRMIDASLPAQQARSLLARLKEMLEICTSASEAAHHYEDLKSLSNAELKVRNLERADLPRAAFRKLTGKR